MRVEQPGWHVNQFEHEAILRTDTSVLPTGPKDSAQHALMLHGLKVFQLIHVDGWAMIKPNDIQHGILCFSLIFMVDAAMMIKPNFPGGKKTVAF